MYLQEKECMSDRGEELSVKWGSSILRFLKFNLKYFIAMT